MMKAMNTTSGRNNHKLVIVCAFDQISFLIKLLSNQTNMYTVKPLMLANMECDGMYIHITYYIQLFIPIHVCTTVHSHVIYAHVDVKPVVICSFGNISLPSSKLATWTDPSNIFTNIVDLLCVQGDWILIHLHIIKNGKFLLEFLFIPICACHCIVLYKHVL